MAATERYAFAEFLLDATERRLSKLGRPIALEPKAHDVLVALVRRAGRLVTRRELLDLVWPESFVNDGILAVHVTSLRKALGDDARQSEYIETVPRSGYRFVGSVTRPAGEPVEAPGRWPCARRPEAYELFGRGRSHLLAASMNEVPNAVAAFRAATDLDPTYAAAHAGLALACCAQAELRVAPLTDSYREARAAALRALAMDGTCADAQVALGAVLYLSDWNWIGAARSLKRALDLNPNHTEAYLLYGRLLETEGHLDRGLEMKQRALERDPFSPLVHLQISLSYWNQRRYDEAIDWANRTLEIDPRHPHAREHLAAAYLKKGDLVRYIAENIAHAELHGVPAEALEPLRKAYADGGRAGVLAFVLEHAGGQNGASDIMLTAFNAEAGRIDAAFHHLRRALDTRDPALVHLAVAPQWDPLRADPRFNQCLAQMGLVRAAELRRPE
jgi:DNA-binding winged helix-turn-helix (wHTH) protein/Tfp pilus assembly protein PilF